MNEQEDNAHLLTHRLICAKNTFFGVFLRAACGRNVSGDTLAAYPFPVTCTACAQADAKELDKK